jgi:hypothetical protein
VKFVTGEEPVGETCDFEVCSCAFDMAAEGEGSVVEQLSQGVDRLIDYWIFLYSTFDSVTGSFHDEKFVLSMTRPHWAGAWYLWLTRVKRSGDGSVVVG